MYKLFLTFLFLIFSYSVLSKTEKQQASSQINISKVDSSKNNIRSFNQKALDQYSKDPAFIYEKEKSDGSLGWWDRFWTWVWHLIENLFHQEKETKSSSIPIILKYLLLVLVIIGLVFLVIKLMGDDLANILSKKPAQVNLPYSESLENIHEITFEEEIEKALKQRNYKVAVRLLYLRSLKQLNDAKLIHWQIEKTNSTYLEELTNEEHKQFFSVLTQQFEYVWYGDFSVDHHAFERIRNLFHDFKKTIS